MTCLMDCFGFIVYSMTLAWCSSVGRQDHSAIFTWTFRAQFHHLHDVVSDVAAMGGQSSRDTSCLVLQFIGFETFVMIVCARERTTWCWYHRSRLSTTDSFPESFHLADHLTALECRAPSLEHCGVLGCLPAWATSPIVPNLAMGWVMRVFLRSSFASCRRNPVV